MVDIGKMQGRKSMSLILLLVAALWATPTCLAQQVTVTPYPPGVYGTWPIVVPSTTDTNDISTDVKCSVINGIETCKCNGITCTQATTCTPATTLPQKPYYGQLLLENGGVVGILLNVPWTSVYTASGLSQQDWTAMDELLIEAQACGLNVALALSMPLDNVPPFAGPPGLPQWVADQITCSAPSCPNGMMIQETVILGTPPSPLTGLPANSASNICPPQTSSFTTPCLVPVFWDTTFNMDRVGFIKAAADHIYTSGLLSPAVQQNIVAVLVQPFGATDGDWFIPDSASDVASWQAANYSTSSMFGAAQKILSAAAKYFPTLNLKLSIQVDLDIPYTGTDAGLATRVLDWAYGASSGFSGRFFAQLNFVNATNSPPDGTCPAGATQRPCSLFNLIGQYQPQVGLQDVAAAVDGAEDMCQQNGGAPCTPCDSPPVQYVCVSQSTWARVVQTYTPRFWEISRGDATTATGLNNTPANHGCPITVSGQAAMRAVFSIVTTQMGGSVPMASAVPCDEISVTATGLAYSRVSRTFNGTVTIQNISSNTIYGPFQVLSAALTSGVTLANATGSFDGTQYVTVPNASSLAPGQTAPAAVQFNNPAFVTINFTPVVYSGSL